MQKIKKLRQQQKGFTIIEIMIVLAIAALIMLIVFEAVPALERSSRNTQRKNDAGNILTSVGTYVSNNNGQLPSTQCELNQAVSGITLGYYVNGPTSGNCGTGATVIYSTTPPNACGTIANCANGDVTTENLYFIAGYSCSGNSPQAGSARGYAVYYEVETGANAAQAECIAS